MNQDISSEEQAASIEVGASTIPVTASTNSGPNPAVVTAPPEPTASVDISAAPLTKLRSGYITLLVLASFGISMALVVPISYSLALKVDQLAPGHAEVLGFILGVASIVVVITNPIVGMVSDRTNTRIGRRRPYAIGGLIIGVAALALIAWSPNLWLVGLGWAIANVALGNVTNALTFIQGDRLPDSQRGKVSALVGLGGQVAAIFGVGLAYVVKNQILLVFLVPAFVGAALVIVYLVFTRDPVPPIEGVSKLTFSGLLRNMVFNPRKAPDYAWNWLGRFIFFVGLYFNTTFSTFFYSQRLHMPVEEVAGTVSIIGGLGVIAAVLGALLSGFLSDRFHRRRLFTLISAILFAAGAVTEAFAYSFVALVVGAVLMNLAIAVFSAVDQAISLTVIPDRAQVGRYLSILVYSQKIPSAIAPLIASGIILIGAAGGEKNFTLVYLIGGVLAVVGGLIILFRVRSVR
jgi:MFS family permease